MTDLSPKRRLATAPMARLIATAVVTSALLAGCVMVPKDQRLLHPRTGSEMGLGSTPDVVPSVPVAPDWWQAMGDPQLDRIMADALSNSPTLDEAAARLRVAQTMIAGAKAGLMPQVSGDVSATDERFSNRYIYPAPLGGSTSWISNAEVDLHWSLDLAGRQKELVVAARAFTHAAALNAAAARVTLSGSVAQAYVNLARADAQARLAREFVTSREASLKLVEARRAANLGTDIDVAAARTLLAEARQAVVRAQGAQVLMVHALAALAGRGPDYYATIGAPALHFDAALPVPRALPADVLGRRADLLAARTQVDLAIAGQQIAKADFYPNVDLRAFVGAQALGLGSLLTGAAMDGGVGPALHLPIFSGGAITARYTSAVAGADVAIAQYNGAVVRAVREAADALSALDTNRADAAQQADVVAGLQKTVALDKVRLDSGLSTRFDVLNAGERLLSARQAGLDLAADGALRRIQLLVALGGGFSPIADQKAGDKPAASTQR